MILWLFMVLVDVCRCHSLRVCSAGLSPIDSRGSDDGSSQASPMGTMAPPEPGSGTFADLEATIREAEDIHAGHKWLDDYIRELVC